MDIKLSNPERLGHLPIVMDVLRRTKILDVIDSAMREDPRSKVSTSECVCVILLAVFIGEHGLWRLRERLSPFDMKTIMQDAGFDLDEFPEERLGKALDDLYRFGLDKLMTSIAIQVIEQFSLDTDFLHFDTTTLSFYGAYEQEDILASLGKIEEPPKVTYGYSKAKRPDLKQILFGSLVVRDGGIPIFGKAMDGNQSDSVAAAAFFEHIRKMVSDPREVCCVADSKGWCSRVLEVVCNNGMHLLSRLPRNNSLHDIIMEGDFDPEGTIEQPVKKKGEDPDYYEYQGYEATEVIECCDEEGKKSFKEVPCRAVRVYSSGQHRRKRKSLERMHEREKEGSKKRIRKWQSRKFACREDAQRTLDRQKEDHGWTTLSLHGVIEQVDGPVKAKRGRPRKDPALDTDAVHYRIQYTTKRLDDSIIDERLYYQSQYVLIRTAHDDWHIDDSDMILRYKGQYHVEHGFAWLKSRAAINPMFVELERRVATLCLIYCLGLLVWNLIQRTVRKNLADWNKGLPYHRNKPSDKITTRFIFELFAKVQSQEVQMPGMPSEKLIFGTDEWTKLACKALLCRPDVLRPIK